MTTASRCFKVLLGGEETAKGRLFDLDSYRDENFFMQWENFGAQSTGIFLNDVYIEPASVTAEIGGKKYFFEQNINGRKVVGWCEFVGGEGFGHITIGDAGYVLRLEPWAPRYDVKIVRGVLAGAEYNDGQRRLTWDASSAQWAGAPWGKDQLMFGYEVKSERDPVTDEQKQYVQMLFSDLEKGTQWDLLRGDDFYAEMSSTNMMSFQADDPPLQPERAGDDITSVFPARASFQFDRFAFSFTGAYRGSDGQVYAVKGEAHDPLAGAFEMQDGARLSCYGGQIYKEGVQPEPAFLRKNHLTLVGGTDTLEFSSDFSQIVGGARGKRVQGTLVSPRVAGFTAAADNADLSVKGLLAMNPMAMDADKNWYDAVGRSAMEDFYRILVNHMDPTLRSKFISATPPELTPEVRHIAYDSSENVAFYRALQTPYLTKSLSLSTQESSKLLNGARASKKLKKGCASNAVYRRHADKLYRLHWLRMFPATTAYLKDQAEVNHDVKLDAIFNALAIQVSSRMKAMDADPDSKERWTQIHKELDALKQWGRSKKVYWAAMLYYQLLTTWLPVLEKKMSDGHLSQDTAQDIKNISSLFSILEGTEGNPGGQTFQMAFLDAVRAFQVGTVIPQYVDYTGDPAYFMEVLDSVFSEFIKKYASSTDPAILERVRAMQELQQNRAVTLQFVGMMQATIKILGPAAAWSKIVSTFQKNSAALKVTNALMKAQAVAVGMGVAGFIMVMTAGDFNSLSEKEKILFIGLSVGTFASIMLTIVRGIVRVATMWRDFQGTWMGIKIFFGAKDVFAKGQMVTVSSKLSNGFAKWFARTREESMLLQEQGQIGTTAKMFGRNMSEFGAQVFGAVMAIVTIVWSAIEIANSKDDLDIAMNAVMIGAASLQLIAIVGGWTVAYFALGAGASAFLSVCGALSVAAAVAGIVIMIVIMTRSPEPPPDPIKDFANAEAANAGLKMEQLIDIDYFDIVPTKDGKSFDGLALRAGAGSFLKAAVAPAAPTLAALTHAPDTLFFIDTDDQGVSMIFTRLSKDDRPVTVYLTAGTDGTTITTQGSPEAPQRNASGQYNPVDVKAYEEAVQRQRWKCTCMGDVSMFTPSKDKAPVLMEGSFTIENAFYQGKYLGFEGANIRFGASASRWKLSMEQIGPGKLSYVPDPFIVNEGARGLTSIPVLVNRASAPSIWEITPDLPAEFELVREGDAAGTIRQKEGVTAKTFAKRSFRVTVSNTIAGQVYSAECSVSLEVLAPGTQPVAYMEMAYA